MILDPNHPGGIYEVSDMEGINWSGDSGNSWQFVEGHISGEMFNMVI